LDKRVISTTASATCTASTATPVIVIAVTGIGVIRDLVGVGFYVRHLPIRQAVLTLLDELLVGNQLRILIELPFGNPEGASGWRSSYWSAVENASTSETSNDNLPSGG
jgi:hypothetical protein